MFELPIYLKSRRIFPVLLILALFVTAFPGISAAQAPDVAPADGGLEWQGVVEAMPGGGFIGNWVIGGKTFVADASTRIKQEHGPLQVGVCAKVEYQVVSGANRALKIERDSENGCNGSGGGGGNHESAKAYGRIDSMPGGLVGNWVIGGVTYTANASTRFEQEHGAFTPGACVEVEYINGAPRQATKIASEHDYKCSGGSGGGGGDAQPRGEMYGTITSFPQGLIGQWNIGGMTFVADASTQFEQEHTPFAAGVLVEVKFYTDANNVNHAIKIESKYGTGGDGSGGDHGSSHEGHEGHAYGLIDAMPSSGLQGAWVIGGINYMADANTRFEQEHGGFAVGVNVKVRYYTNNSGQRIATKIETSNENGGATAPNHFKLYGFVQQMPSPSFQGQWVVNGVTLTADLNTRFEETHGLLAIGAYVEVEYTQVGGVNQMVKIETQVPPGAGPNNDFGRVESNAAASLLSLDASNATWIVGGKSYVVTPATDLNDLGGALTVGNFARVNSYSANGQLVATRIAGVSLNHHIYLPATAR